MSNIDHDVRSRRRKLVLSPHCLWLPFGRAHKRGHPKVSEAAIVGYRHDIKGQGIYAYVTLVSGEPPSAELHKEIVVWGAQGDWADSKADLIEFLLGLPKTCSGKIMRRILRKIAEDEFGPIGDS